ncbi:hypothetical protein EVJ32_05070 [Exiguobacterium sp. SH5S4]|uniref:hypothetical protein n=1 Tax=Exiguobacterium sp. SH5S4 TaxID=2510961 RepID=UPI001040B685|nr:hypothetical protein [Exiguobacterium sp. SH5S4]TCI26749.1 hypothetical protein EVJ32_05070 [Exiguobacterium sp. SH5S4]
MIKELLKNQDGVKRLQQYRYKCFSVLTLEQKKKVCRSWIRGSDAKWISCYYEISEKDVTTCTKELYQMAMSLGQKNELTRDFVCSDGLVYLIGEMLNHWSVRELRKEIGLTTKQLSAIRERYELLTGIPSKRTPDKDRNHFSFVRDEISRTSPHDGSKMKVLDCPLQMTTELKFDGMDFTKVKDSYYCMESLREFFGYDGDDNGNPKGLYEIRYEYID